MKKISSIMVLLILVTPFVSSINLADEIKNKKIGVVNSDDGINVENNYINYGEKLLSKYDYVEITTINQVENNNYLAYIVIPGNFSRNIYSINTTPEQSVIGYNINIDKDNENYEYILNKLLDLELSLNKDISGMYVNAVLSEFYNAQNQVDTVLNNSDKNAEAILNLSLDDSISFIDTETLNLPQISINDPNYNDTFLSSFNKSIEEFNENLNTDNDSNENAINEAISSVESSIEETNKLKTQIDNYTNTLKNQFKININDTPLIVNDINIKYNVELTNDGIKIVSLNGDDIVVKYDDKSTIYNENIIIIKYDGTVSNINGDDLSSLTKANNTIKTESTKNKLDDISNYVNDEHSDFNNINEYIIYMNATYYLDRMYIYAVEQYINDITKNDNFDSSYLDNYVMPYKNKINEALSIYNQYTNNNVSDLYTYNVLRSSEFEGIKFNYDFNTNNLDIIKTFINGVITRNNNQVLNENPVSLIKSKEEDEINNSISKIIDLDEVVKNKLSNINTYISIDGSQSVFVNEFSNNVNVVSQPITQYQSYTSLVISDANRVISNNNDSIAKYQESINSSINYKIKQMQDTNNQTSQENKDLLQDFANKLSFIKNGNVANQQVVEVIVAPIRFKDESEPIIKEEDVNEEKQDNKPVISLLIAIAGLTSYIIYDKYKKNKK